MTQGDKETVTVPFIANYEVDPEQFDLRVRDPSKIRRELASATIPGSDDLQETLVSSDEAMERYREKVMEAKDSNDAEN